MSALDLPALFGGVEDRVNGLFGADAGATSATQSAFDQFMQRRTPEPLQYDPFAKSRDPGQYDPFAKSRDLPGYDPFAKVQVAEYRFQQQLGAKQSLADQLQRDKERQQVATARPGGTGREATLGRSSASPVGLPTDQWRGMIEQVANEYGVDPDAVEAIMMLESDGNERAYSKAGAIGLMQVMPFNFQPGEDPWDPATNIRAGVRYFAAKYKEFGNYNSAAASYLGAADANGNPTKAADANGTDGFAYVNRFNENLNLVRQKRQARGSGAGGGSAGTAGDVFPVEGYRGGVEKHWGEVTGAADLFGTPGTPIRAVRGGQVVSAGWSDVGGWNVTVVDPQSGLMFYYAHLQNQPLVAEGQTIGSGTQIGALGDTGNAAGVGPMLHLGIGPRILSGDGPNGGSGVNQDGTPFDATSYLTRLLGGG